jgi:hypothetical protein
MESCFPELQTLCYWIRERELIRIRREQGNLKPWTADPILQKYRFCNVHREDDRVTRWIRQNWSGWVEHPHYTLGMAIARFFNWPDTLAEIGFPVLWDPKITLAKIRAREARKEKVWSSAYIVSTNGVQMSKPMYIINYVLDPIAKAAYRPTEGTTLEQASLVILNFYGVSNFLSGQIVADLKNTPGHPLGKAQDLATWCTSGPGSIRGLNRLMQRRINHPISEREFRVRVNLLREHVREWIDVDAQDMQNCLCEVDKYIRTRNGEGRPRQNYPGG